jgi:cysteinyl-tRNA synthetase
MASKYLGDQFEIHTGGIDHVAVHHTNEIAQAEHALGVRPWVKYWMHGAWLTMEGAKIAKSAGLAPNLDDLAAIGVSPSAFRYYLMTAHYRSTLDLSLEALRAAETALDRLSLFVTRHGAEEEPLSAATSATSELWRKQFYDALYDDLDAPRAIASLWCVVADASLPPGTRARLIVELGEVLGLGFQSHVVTATPEISSLLENREQARAARDFSRADALRIELWNRGFSIEDSPHGPLLRRVH